MTQGALYRPTIHMSLVNRISHRFSYRHPSAASLLLAGAALFVCLALGQTEAMSMEIAILKSSSIGAYDQAIEGFKATGPSDAIYAEYDVMGDIEHGKKLARKIRASDASLVLAVGLKAALAAKIEIVDVPIVYMMILDPSKHKLDSPNMTGTLMEIPPERQFKTLRAFLPNVHQLGILANPRNSIGAIKEAGQQASAFGFNIKEFAVESEKEVPPRLRELLSTTDALFLVPDSTVLTDESIGFILESSLARRVPVISFSPEFTRLGALLSLSVSYGEVGRETGKLARRILQQDVTLPAKPMPIERLKVSVNMKTARFLGVVFPKHMNHLIDETF